MSSPAYPGGQSAKPATNVSGKKKNNAGRRIVLDTIEISSEEDVAESVSLMNLGRLQKVVRQLKEENKSLKVKTAERAEENAQLKLEAVSLAQRNEDLQRQLSAAVQQSDADKKVLKGIAESTRCELCSMRLKRVWVLPCGHAFCKSCIRDWFHSLLMGHCAANENYHPQTPELEKHLEQLRLPQIPTERARLLFELRSDYLSANKPTYTCPNCRAIVTAPPLDCTWARGMLEDVANWAPSEGELAGECEAVWEVFFPLHNVDFLR